MNTINKRTEAELCNFQISKQRIKKIEARKQKFGEFSSIEDMLELDGFGVKVLEKFCESILAKTDDEEKDTKPIAESDEQNLQSRRKQQFVSPNFSEKLRNSVSSCVSFYIGLNFVAWTKLRLDFDERGNELMCVEEWTSNQIGNDDKKLSLSDLIQISLRLVSKIPEADVYVIEAAQTPQVSQQPSNPIQMNISVQKSQLLAMFGALIASRGEKTNTIVGFDTTNQLEEDEEAEMGLMHQQNLFFLRNFLASRLYKTFVGNERVSTERVIEKLLRLNYSVDVEKKPSFDTLDVPQHLREYYRSSSKLDREFMGQSMLIGLTFMKLCVTKCPQSVAMLNKRSRE